EPKTSVRRSLTLSQVKCVDEPEESSSHRIEQTFPNVSYKEDFGISTHDKSPMKEAYDNLSFTEVECNMSNQSNKQEECQEAKAAVTDEGTAKTDKLLPSSNDGNENMA